MKLFTRNRFIFLIAIIILVILIPENKNIVPENIILNYSSLEILNFDFTSCQIDCTFGEGIFHEECIGFNGCEDSPYLRNKYYCENDSDCEIDLGCCSTLCKGLKCFSSSFCAVANSESIKAHEFSCEYNIECVRKESCKGNYEASCRNNTCRILN